MAAATREGPRDGRGRGPKLALALVATALLSAPSPEGRVASAQERVAAAPATTVEARARLSFPGVAAAAPAPPLSVFNANTNGRVSLSFYDDRGAVDRAALEAFRGVAGDGAPADLAERVVQLVVKAAYELGAREIVLVSTLRAPDRRGRGGYHTTGEAIDFRLGGVSAARLAAHLRKFPRAGVGVYTHPKTQYVHVDVRDESYHWLDASPPGRTWKEARIADPKQKERDSAYGPEADRPDWSLATGATQPRR